jgi:hypothetical protein
MEAAAGVILAARFQQVPDYQVSTVYLLLFLTGGMLIDVGGSTSTAMAVQITVEQLVIAVVAVVV